MILYSETKLQKFHRFDFQNFFIADPLNNRNISLSKHRDGKKLVKSASFLICIFDRRLVFRFDKRKTNFFDSLLHRDAIRSIKESYDKYIFL